MVILIKNLIAVIPWFLFKYTSIVFIKKISFIEYVSTSKENQVLF